MPKLSHTQAELVAKLCARPGENVFRIKGGFWTLPSVPLDRGGVPEYSVDIRTIRALEARGVLERTHELPDEWRDPRRLARKS